jgi:hypothetical protein
MNLPPKRQKSRTNNFFLNSISQPCSAQLSDRLSRIRQRADRAPECAHQFQDQHLRGVQMPRVRLHDCAMPVQAAGPQDARLARFPGRDAQPRSAILRHSQDRAGDVLPGRRESSTQKSKSVLAPQQKHF